MPKHGCVSQLQYNKKAGIYPASLTHDTLRTISNRIDAIKIPDGLFPACHQLWGQPDDLTHF
jgi:hypothetical protein